MGLVYTTPNYTGPARKYVQLLQNLDSPVFNAQTTALLTDLLDSPTNVLQYAQSTFPVTLGRATNADTVLVWMSGVRVAGAVAQMVQQYLYPEYSMANTRINFYIELRATNAFFIAGLNLPSIMRNKVVLVGHSMGGAIALALARNVRQVNPAAQIWVCTFGAPKVHGLNTVSTSADMIARWTNPTDNVPSLPPLAPQAPILYGALSATRREILQQWRHPCQAYSVTPSGNLAKIDDPPSVPITLTTLTSALQSATGLFGPGHALGVYYSSLLASSATYSEPAIPPLIAGPGIVAPPTPPVQAPVPASVPPPVNNVAVQASFAAFRDSAIINDAVPTRIPMPNQPTVSKTDNVWSFDWMGYQVATGPSKRKCQALSRHLRRFLRLYQGVGQSQSHEFVYALAAYLTEASDPGGAYKPILNDGGNPPLIPVAGG